MAKGTRKGISTYRNVTKKEVSRERAYTVKREEKRGMEAAVRREDAARQDVRTGTRYVEEEEEEENGPCAARTPGYRARSILELSRMLHSHRPLFRSPSTLPLPPHLPLSLSFFLTPEFVNMPRSFPSGFIPRKGNPRLLQTLHREGVPTSGTRVLLFSLTLTDLGVGHSLFLSLPPSFYAPQDFGADCEIKGSPKSLK